MSSDPFSNEPNCNDPFGDLGNETKVGLQADRETDGHSHLDRPPPWTDGDQLGDFVLERLLGSGSSSWVYSARHCADNNKRLALKLLRPESPEKMLWNKLGFRRMMSVEHENLVRVDRIYQLGEYVGLAMEQVDGLTFAQTRKTLLKLEPSVAYEQLLSMLRQFSAGLAVMHGRGLVHRDMKPANMMIGSNGIAKIIDYGLVDPIQLNAIDCKPRGHILGTPRYIAPEVYWSQRYLPSGDIFCLGIVILETLQGIQNNAGLRWTELARSKQDQEDRQRITEAIDGLQDSVPSAILETCRQMLSRDPADRPRAVELARVGQTRTASVSVASSDAIVGRESELATIESWADQIFSGSVGRLHLCGPSGIGKSCLIDSVVKYIESKRWGQLFRAQCRRGSDQPMQAFDQICDAIADRYMQSDRESLELDPVNATILRDAFPVLCSVLKSSVNSLPAGSNTRPHPIPAAQRLSEQLRLVGPLFLVIDDAQWSDQDSRNTFDHLAEAAGSEGLGIITTSLGSEQYRVQAQQTVQLGSLSLEDSISLLAQSVERWNVLLSQPIMETLAKASAGVPFRILEIANECRRGGSLSNSAQSIDAGAFDHGLIDGLWQRRVEQLSDDARSVLPYIVTAGGRMSTAQLGQLSGLKDSIDAAVSELAQQQLIRDEATGGECIQILHDRVADELLASLGENARQSAHHAWASHLARQDNPRLSAARIAGHFFAAGEPGRALSHAILAAEDSENRSATYEAARLYKRVAKHVEGKEKLVHLRNAGRCFRDALYPGEAAECYRELADVLGPDEKFEAQLMCGVLLTRAGRFDEVRAQFCETAGALRLPKPKSGAVAVASVFARRLQLSVHGSDALMSKLREQANQVGEQPQPLDQRTKQRVDLCFSVARPLSYFDLMYSAELNLFGSRLLLNHADAQLRINAMVTSAAHACFDNTPNRAKGERQLMELREIAEKIGDPRSRGDVAAGLAVVHGLASRWHKASQLISESIAHYKNSHDLDGFEIAHMKWLQVGSMWRLGQWAELKRTTVKFYDIGLRRNDRFQQMMACSGFSATAWLAADDAKTLEEIQRENYQSVENLKRFQLIDAFNWVGLALRQLYNGRYDEAWNDYQATKPKFRTIPFPSIQLVRVNREQLAVVTALHQLNRRYTEPLVLRVSLLVDQLRKEQTPYTTMLANLYGGLLTQRIASVQNSRPGTLQAISLLATAREEAAQQGLIPFQLAASDALHGSETGTPSNQLIQRMSAEGVVHPLKFQRMFTVDFCR